MTYKKLRYVDHLESEILDYIINHPRTDAEEIAKAFAIPILEAVELTERLLNVGLLKEIQ